jgi:alpha-glucosidase (family GH31 glycosyl hydrolase)
MLGDTILVAPVVKEGALARDIYLPRGSWISPTGESFVGPQLLPNYPADLATLPYFFRQQ